MCGIVGVYSSQLDIATEGQFIKWATDAMVHRGPDDEGLWHNKSNIVLGFRRLSIRDTSQLGHQPMLYNNGDYSIVFNGEIYNTSIFFEDLKSKGYIFNSTSDTEVLFYALIEYGIADVINKLDGIFAFAFYNDAKDELVLARDRAGVKPLYYSQNGDYLVFSSEYSHLVKHHSNKSALINKQAVNWYLKLGYIPEGCGFLNNTQLMPHGHYLVQSGLKSELVCYYEYGINNTDGGNLDELLAEAVKSQLVSDVPLGSFLSGGVDSPLVTSYASTTNTISTYSIGVPDKEMDESVFAAAYAQIIGTEHHAKKIDERELVELIDEHIAGFSEPFADFSSLPTLLLSKFVKQDITVALSGDGGDELFWGYPRFSKALKHFEYIGKPLKTYIKWFIARFFGQGERLPLNLKNHKSFADYYYQAIFIGGAKKWADKLVPNSNQEPFFLTKAKNTFNKSPKNKKEALNLARKIEFDLHLQRVLIKVDRASMYHSLEVRVPLLSNRILDYSEGIDYASCLNEHEGKLNLKKLLAEKTDATMPYAKKKGFTIPLNKWINTVLYERILKSFSEMPLKLREVLNRDQALTMLEEHKVGKGDWSWSIWAVFSLIEWYKVNYEE